MPVWYCKYLYLLNLLSFLSQYFGLSVDWFNYSIINSFQLVIQFHIKNWTKAYAENCINLSCPYLFPTWIFIFVHGLKLDGCWQGVLFFSPPSLPLNALDIIGWAFINCTIIGRVLPYRENYSYWEMPYIGVSLISSAEN